MTILPDTFIDGGNRISVDIVDRSGDLVGPGPLITCLSLDTDTLLSQAGNFTARFPANDPRLAYLQLKRHFLDFYYDGELIFFGLAEQSSEEIDDNGERILTITGRDSLAELDETSIDFTQFNLDSDPVDNTPNLILTAYNGLNVGLEWTTPVTGSTTDTYVYLAVAGEPALAALTRVAEQINESFRLNGRRGIDWLASSNAASGVRAVQSAGDAIAAETNTNICFIQRLSERRNSTGIVTEILSFGSGLGETRLDTIGTNRGTPTGYTYNATTGALQSDAALAYIGKSIRKHINFKDIRPLFNTDADIQSAKDYLFDVALAWLQRNDDINDAVEYDLDVLQLPPAVQVGTTIHVIYADDRLDLDVALVVLGIRTSIGSDGAAAYSLTVSPINQWRLRETNNQVSQMEEGEIFAAHPQIDANSYWKPYKEWIGDDQINHLAEFPFFLSAEIVTIRQVLFRYKVEQILAAYVTYALADDTLPNAAANTVDQSAGQTDSDGATTTDNSGAGLTNFVAPGSTNNDGGGVVGPSPAATTDAAAYTGGIAQTDLANAVGTTTPSADDTAQNTAGTSIGSGTASTMTLANVRDPLTGGTLTGINTAIGDPHQHDLQHFHDVPTGSHTHTGITLPQHTHPIGVHTHIITATHRHVIPSHTHTSSLTHGHTYPNHVHVISATHQHTTPNHIHATLAHVHIISAVHHHAMTPHIHPLPALVATFGLQRIPALDSYAITDLEYRVNGNDWTALISGTPVAGGWTEADVTPLVQNPAGLKRPYQEYNVIEIRRSDAALAGKSACVRVELGIRATVQSIVSYS